MERASLKRITVFLASILLMGVLYALFCHMGNEIFGSTLSYADAMKGTVLSEMLVMGAPAFLFYFLAGKESNPRRDTFRWKNIPVCMVVVCLTLFFMHVFRELVPLLSWFFSKTELYAMSEETVISRNITQNIIAVAAVGIATPYLEELWFRKICVVEFRDIPGICVVFMSAIYFMVMHESIRQLVFITPLAFVLGAVAYRTGRTKETVLIHILCNIVGILFSYDHCGMLSYEYTVICNNTMLTVVTLFSLGLICAILAFLLGEIIKKFLNADIENCDTMTKKNKGLTILYTVVMSIGILIVVFCRI